MIFVTSNDVKFMHANHMLAQFGITLDRERMDLQELQSESGEEITRHKANQAFERYNTPLVVNDDSWRIPGLQGFPGPYMKSMNKWLTSDDWLNLTRPLHDRRIILQQHIVFQDAHGQHYFVQEVEGLLLTEAKGEHPETSWSISSFDNGLHSVAEIVVQNRPAVDPSTQTAWHHFGEWFSQQKD